MEAKGPSAGMKCSKFEESIGDYLDGRLDAAARSSFGAHALQCRRCRALLDDVKNRLKSFEVDEEAGSCDLETVLEMIPESQTVLGCDGFESLITEFLDGYVPAPVYHKFAQHSDECAGCSKILTDVVYAVAACHSVHTYEDYDVPASLTDKLVEACSVLSEKGMTGRLRSGLAEARSRAGLLIPSIAVPRMTMASGLILAFLSLWILGVPNLGLRQVYNKAQARAGDLYTQGMGIYSQKRQVEARVQQVGLDIVEVWKSLNDARSLPSADEKRGEETSPK